MSSLQNCKTAKLRVSAFFLKNNCLKTCTIQEKFVPLQQVAKMTLATKICGIANGKIFVNHGASFS
jgi:hypothetical protein